MCGTSDGEHCWGHVHAEDVETMIGHEGRHSAWSATNIGNTPDGLSLDQLDESHKQRPVNGVLCRGVDVGASELDIRHSGHVVDGSSARHVVFAKHAARLGDRQRLKTGRTGDCPVPEHRLWGGHLPRSVGTRWGAHAGWVRPDNWR